MFLNCERVLQLAGPGLVARALFIRGIELLLLRWTRATTLIIIFVWALWRRGGRTAGATSAAICWCLVAGTIAPGDIHTAVQMLCYPVHDEISWTNRALACRNLGNGAIFLILAFLWVRHDSE